MGLLDSVKDKVEGQLNKRSGNNNNNDDYNSNSNSDSYGQQSGNDSYGGQNQGGDSYQSNDYQQQGELNSPLPHINQSNAR